MGSEMAEGLKRRLEALETFTVDVIYGRRKGLKVRLYGGFLRSLSLLFTSVVKSRLWLYQRRILRNSHLGCMVIVVGNLTVGGTGKTPVVEVLARTLRQRGRHVAILSRGYKSKKEPMLRKAWRAITHKEEEPPKIVSDGKTVKLDSEHAGDEPFMLAQNLPGVAVVVDKDRVKAGRYAIKHLGADTLVLDDGFQYFRLKDHMQLLLIDKSNPFGNGNLLPRGILREPIAHLKRASYIFLTKSDGVPDDGIIEQIRQHKPDAEIIECTHRPKFLREVQTHEERSLESLNGQKVAAFCGIAVPESFEAFVERYGAEVVHKQWFLDHHRFTQSELKRFFNAAVEKGAEIIVTTEKDAVRLDADVEPPLPLFFLRVEVEILSGVADFEEAVARMCFPKQKVRTTRPPMVRRNGTE